MTKTKTMTFTANAIKNVITTKNRSIRSNRSNNDMENSIYSASEDNVRDYNDEEL